jgi:hypothetical protein
MKAVDNSILARWRMTDAVVVLNALAEYAKEDQSFCARGDGATSRWHATIRGSDVEVLCTGPKFFETRSKRGGGGAVDMAMQLLSLDFKGAVAALVELRV